MEKLKQLRQEKGISQATLAKAIGINHRTVSQYERGITQADYQTLKKLCDYFNVSADYLLGFKEY